MLFPMLKINDRPTNEIVSERASYKAKYRFDIPLSFLTIHVHQRVPPTHSNDLALSAMASSSNGASDTVVTRSQAEQKGKKEVLEHLLQTPGIEPGTFCATNSAHFATDC